MNLDRNLENKHLTECKEIYMYKKFQGARNAVERDEQADRWKEVRKMVYSVQFLI